jgi:hypothetical protein
MSSCADFLPPQMGVNPHPRPVPFLIAGKTGSHQPSLAGFRLFVSARIVPITQMIDRAGIGRQPAIQRIPHEKLHGLIAPKANSVLLAEQFSPANLLPLPFAHAAIPALICS